MLKGYMQQGYMQLCSDMLRSPPGGKKKDFLGSCFSLKKNYLVMKYILDI